MCWNLLRPSWAVFKWEYRRRLRITLVKGREEGRMECVQDHSERGEDYSEGDEMEWGDLGDWELF